MKDDFLECPELVGKTVQAVRIYRDDGDGTECQIDFSDGTSFSVSVSVTPKVEANLTRPGVGEPDQLRNYQLE